MRFSANWNTCEFWNCGRKNGPPSRAKRCDRHVRQAAVETRVLRHALDAVLRVDVHAERRMKDVRSHLVVRDAEFAEHGRAEHARPSADGALAAVQDVAGKVARRHRIVENRRLDAVGVLEAVAAEQMVAAGRQAVIDPDVELIDVVVEDAVGDEVVVEESRRLGRSAPETARSVWPPPDRRRTG